MRASLLTILLLMSVGCEDDNGPTSSVCAVTQLLRDQRHQRDRQPWRAGRSGCDVPAPCDRRRREAAHMARLPERRTGSREQQSADARARPHRHRAVVQRRPAAHRQQRRRASFAHGGCRAFRGRTRAADQRPVDRFSQPEPARHPHRLERRRDRSARHDLRGLDVRFGERQGAGRTFGRDGTEPEHGRHARVVELRSCHQPELREHGAWRRSGQVLLFRGQMTDVLRARCYGATCSKTRATCDAQRARTCCVQRTAGGTPHSPARRRCSACKPVPYESVEGDARTLLWITHKTSARWIGR